MDAGLKPRGLADVLADKTPKEQFDALTGPSRLWWRHCQDAVRAMTQSAAGAGPAASASHLQQLSADEERLSGLFASQAGSEEAGRSFMESAHMIADVTRVLGGSGGELRGVLLAAARYWARSGLLVPAPPVTGPLLSGQCLSATLPSLREPIRGLAGELAKALAEDPESRGAGPSWVMALLTALRLAGAEPWRGRATRVPVLFDKPDSAGGATGMLEICEFAGGPPGLYPDPEDMSSIRANEEFTDALIQAWSYAIRGQRVNGCVMWRLALSDEAPVLLVAGGSLGAPLAIALREHLRGRAPRNRPWAAVQAAFLGLRPRCAITGALAPGDTLAAVGGMQAKIQAARASNWRLVAPQGNQSAAIHVPNGLHVYWASSLRRASRLAHRWRPVRTSIAAAVALALIGTGLAIRFDTAAADRASLQRAVNTSRRKARRSTPPNQPRPRYWPRPRGASIPPRKPGKACSRLMRNQNAPPFPTAHPFWPKALSPLPSARTAPCSPRRPTGASSCGMRSRTARWDHRSGSPSACARSPLALAGSWWPSRISSETYASGTLPPGAP